MFGRDLIEQVHADSKDEDRLIPVIVEKCIDAVEASGACPCLQISLLGLTLEFDRHGL